MIYIDPAGLSKNPVKHMGFDSSQSATFQRCQTTGMPGYFRDGHRSCVQNPLLLGIFPHYIHCDIPMDSDG